MNSAEISSAKEVGALIKQAGFKNKKEFAKAMSLSVVTVNFWGSRTPPPVWLNRVLEWAKKAKNYDEIVERLK